MADRTAYIDKMAAQLKEWDAKIQKLEADATSAADGVAADIQEQINKARSKKDEAQQKLDAVRQAGENAWEELKDGVDQSWKILGDAVKSAADKLKK